MKQFNRKRRALRKTVKEAKDEAAMESAKEELKAHAEKQLKFELVEYEERVKNQPTDMSHRYHLGIRQYSMGNYDEAIASFQHAL